MDDARVTVNSLSRSYRTIALAAPLVAVAGNVAGLVVSYNFEVPPGARHNIYPHSYAYNGKTVIFTTKKAAVWIGCDPEALK